MEERTRNSECYATDLEAMKNGRNRQEVEREEERSVFISHFLSTIECRVIDSL
jgi:hypothetical protein